MANRFGAAHSTPCPKDDALADALVPPIDETGYHAVFDRSAPPGDNPWDLGAADGSIDLYTDVFGVAYQFGHDCTAAP